MEKNRPQVGSGPTYSDSPSDNANSSITSSPTDTLRTSKNSDAKIIKNLKPINVMRHQGIKLPKFQSLSPLLQHGFQKSHHLLFSNFLYNSVNFLTQKCNLLNY